MQFRIGINVGDVIHDDVRVYGDGVNIAARLEAIAEPGGICISGTAYDQVRSRVRLIVTDLGSQLLKNIAEPVHVYRVEAEQPATVVRSQKSLLALPDKPSIAVLPFTNLSSDKEQDYFCDGITEDIITELSRFSELFVIARNSSFQYKGRFPDLPEVGRELGVRYVLEGSIRRVSERVRIAAQLIDATTGAHRWAERYDRTLEDVFAAQDEVARTIVTILTAHVRKAETERTRTNPPNSWQAYDYYLQAIDSLNRFNASLAADKVDELYEARRLLHLSLAIDPKYARSYACLAQTHGAAWLIRLDSDFLTAAARDQAHKFALKSSELDPRVPETHASLGLVFLAQQQLDASIAAFERAMALNHNYVDWIFGVALIQVGDSRRAIDIIKAYMRLDPLHAPLASALLGLAHYMLKEYAQALTTLRACVSQAPNYRTGHVLLAATYAQMDMLEEARAEVDQVVRIEPNYTISGIARPTIAFKHADDDQHYFDGLRKAGLPE